MKTALRAQIQDSIGQRLGIDFAIRDKMAPELLATGFPAIDIPRGTLTEICGPPSSGRTSILNAAFARATRRPEFCALIDAGNSFDPFSATSAGVQLPHLLWVRCGCGSAEKSPQGDRSHSPGRRFWPIVALDLAGVSGTRRSAHFACFLVPSAPRGREDAHRPDRHRRRTQCRLSCSTLQIENRSTGFHMIGDLLRGLAVDAAIGSTQSGEVCFRAQTLYRE